MTPSADATQPAKVARAELRASDQDRDRTAAVLAQGLASGRLTSTEHAERLDGAYAARTAGELAALTRDLPDTGADVAEAHPPAVDSSVVRARFSKVTRGGRWVAGRHTTLSSRFGALIVSLREAVLPGREITLELDALCGKLIVAVPPNARVIDEGGVLFGKRMIAGAGRADDADSTGPGDDEPEGPVIRLTGQARFAKVVVHRGGVADRHMYGHAWEIPGQ
jgi:uncharacterized protein DUF1707